MLPSIPQRGRTKGEHTKPSVPPQTAHLLYFRMGWTPEGLVILIGLNYNRRLIRRIPRELTSPAVAMCAVRRG